MKPVNLAGTAPIFTAPFLPQRQAIRPISGPPPAAGFHAGSPSHPIVPTRPVNVLSGTPGQRSTPRPAKLSVLWGG